MNVRAWRKRVDRILCKSYGITIEEFGEETAENLFLSGLTPEEAVRRIAENCADMEEVEE